MTSSMWSLRDQEALQQVGALQRLAEIIARAADEDLLLKREIFVQNVPQ